MAKSNTFHKSSKIKSKKKLKKKPKFNSKKTKSNKLAAIVETRRRGGKAADIKTFYYTEQGENQDEDFNGLSTTQAVNVIPNLLNYGWQNAQSDPGGAVRDFRGKDIFIRWWKMKYKFDFPQGEKSIKLPMRIQLVWGFCTNPTQYTPYTTPAENTVTAAEYTQHVLSQIEDGFNSPDDQLEFRVKNKSNMRILGKKWIRPDRTARVGLPQQQSWHNAAIEGGPPDVTGTIEWPMNRKYRFTYTNNGTGDAMNYNNQSWIPFALIYMPDYDSINYGDTDDDEPWAIPEVNRVQFQHCSCVWYQDP